MNGPSIVTRTFGLMASVILLMSCASTPPPPVIGEADVKAAEANGSLETLYVRIGKELQTASGEEATSLEALRSEVGTKLANPLKAQIHDELEKTTRIGGAIPLDVIQKEEKRALLLKEWSPTVYNQILSGLNADRTSTQTAIKQREAELADIPQTQPRLRSLATVVTIHRAGSEQTAIPGNARYTRKSGNGHGDNGNGKSQKGASKNYVGHRDNSRPPAGG